MTPTYDIAVIGGGAAGLSVAAGAAQLGAKTALVNQGPLGGDCLYYGCVPSKTLIHAAKIAHEIGRSQRYGLKADLKPVTIAQVMESVKAVIAEIEPNDSPERFRSLGVDVIIGHARFTDPDHLEVNGGSLSARKFVLATGTRPAVPAIEGLAETPHLTNETVFSLDQPVEHLLVLGGGPIGCELAQAFRRLGSQVTLFSSAPVLLPREDHDLTEVIRQQFSEEGIECHLGIQVERVAGDSQQLEIWLQGPSGKLHLGGSQLLLAAGRIPNLEGLGLEKAGVERQNQRLVLDRRLRTTNPKIYACGDVAGPFLFTHMAEHQAAVVLKNALFHWPAKSEQRVVPWCTFTDPELARVGLSEAEAIRQKVPHRVYRLPVEEIDRARTMHATRGFAKVLAAPNGKILGAAIVGPEAGELIHEFVLAMQAGLKLAQISGTIHIYPTLAQLNRRVADLRLKQALTPGRKRWLKRLFRLRGKS